MASVDPDGIVVMVEQILNAESFSPTVAMAGNSNIAAM